MTPQELRRSVIQFAIQGKLNVGLPEDGTGVDVVRNIIDQKTELIKAKIIKKEKALPAITDEEIPFAVPENWCWVRLRDICTKIVDGDHNPPAGVKEKTEYWMLSAQNINQNQLVNLDQVRYLTKEVFDQCTERTAAQKGDIFLTIVATLGRSCVYEGDYNICFQRSVSVISTLIYNYYLKYVFDSGYIQDTMVKNATGTAQKGFYLNQVERLVIPVPPVAEQKRIVAKLEEILPLIDRYEAAWSKLEDFNKRCPMDMQKSILQMAIQGKLVPQLPEEGTGEELFQQIQAEKQAQIKAGKIKKEKPLPEITDEEKPYDIPANWTWVRFGDLGSYKKGPFGSAITKSMFVPKGNGAVKVYEQKNAIQKDATLGDYYIRREYFESKMTGFEVFPGDIIVSCAGTIGETYVMPEQIEQGIINQALMRMKIFEPLYIPYFLTFFDFVLKKDARSSSKGSAIKNIPPFEILKNYLVPIPPLAEQKRIVAKLEEILPLCDRLK